MRTLRIGILGFGYTGRLHLEAWRQTAGVEVVAIGEPSPEARSQVPPGIQACASCEELLSLGLDAVSVCVPTGLHHAVTIAALTAGTDVLLEKPIAVNFEQANEMIAAAARFGRTLFVGMTHRFYPEILAARRLVDEGAIGKIVLIRDSILEHFGFLNCPRWYLDPEAAGGGIVLTSGIHLADRVMWFAGEVPEWVAGAGGNPFLQQPVEDCAQMLLRFPSGRSAQLTLGFLAEPHPLVCDLELVGTRGSIVVHTWSGYELRTAAGTEQVRTYDQEPHTVKVLAGLRGEIAEFCAAIREGRAPRPSVEESTVAMKVVDAFYRSLRSGSMERLA